MKILILSRYSRLGASSRLRLYQFIPYFEAKGITCVIQPLLNDRYLHELYSGAGVSKVNLLKGYYKVFLKLTDVKAFDAVIIEKEIFPFLPPFAEWWLRVSKVPYIVDYDDAIFHNYDRHPNRLIRALLGRKIAYIMRHATAVICGNEYLAGYAREAGARRVIRVPTVIDTDRYGVRDRTAIAPADTSDRSPVAAPADRSDHAPDVVIGWIGSPFSLKFLRGLRPVLQELLDDYPARVHIVGGKKGIGLGDREAVIDWSEEREVELIQGFDIGIMPLEDSPWERGKCGYKLIQYMGCGLPVVGSPVGANEEIIVEGQNGFKPSDESEWKEALRKLILSAPLRREMGHKGREMVEAAYSLNGAAEVWVNEIENTHIK